ncbi:hypothetical protein BKA63DRAFT_23959 [Paraphoma chrysanthemicola]|nr:hypothetical protein BKA63DRAFT_23959 [Paraphoma chrysanthemicola]
MMLSNRDPNGPGSGRASRASNASGMSRNTNKHPSEGGGPARQDLLSSGGPGVMSMLRTSTEIDIAGLVSNPTRNLPRGGASSRLSTASSLSNHSNHTNRHHRQLPSSSSAARHSTPRDHMQPMQPMSHPSMSNAPRYVPDTLSPTMMNIPGSSPLVPMRMHNRDSQRSRSMTHTMPQPEFRPSNNRSMGSLRGQEPMQRSRSPYAHPTGVQRASNRPVSPAWSEPPGSHPSRVQGRGGQGGFGVPAAHGGFTAPMASGGYSAPMASGPYSAAMPPGSAGQQYPPSRMRNPSDPNLGYRDRASQRPRPSSRGRSPSGSYTANPAIDNCPPMPNLAIHYHPAVEQARQLSRSAQGSISSGSTNARTGSDTPSSDLALPPTPRDGFSMNALASSSPARMRQGMTTRIPRNQVSSSPLYYDGSEQWEQDNSAEPEMQAVPTGFHHNVKTGLEERRVIRPSAYYSGSRGVTNTGYRGKTTADFDRSQLPGIVELPATPVGQRITKHLIRKALDPTTTTGAIASSADSGEGRGEAGEGRLSQDRVTTRPVDDETSGSSSLPAARDNRSSTISQAESCLIDSETVGLAIPAITGPMEREMVRETDSVPTSPGSPEKNTDDGMSELLADYEHTGSQRDEDVMPDTMMANKTELPDGMASDHKRKHVQNSSDAQSFKSCTDVLESVSPRAGTDGGPRSAKSTQGDLDAEDNHVKESDGRSFKTCKDVSTPVRIKSAPSSAIPSSSLERIDLQARPTSEMPPSGTAPQVLRKPVIPPRESSFSTIASKFLGGSKGDKKTSMSATASCSTLNATPQPPHVPPRDSSTSTEARQHSAVGTFLIRGMNKAKKVVPKLAKPAQSETPAVDNSEADMADIPPTTQQGDEPNEPREPAEQLAPMFKTPEKAVHKPDVVAEDLKASPPVEYYSPSKPLIINRVMLPGFPEYPMSGLPVRFPQPSSVYSPQDVSLNVRAYSSPPGVSLSPNSPDHSRRDSQSTTHLSWVGRRPYGIPSTNASPPHQSLSVVQEDSTTDLRLSGYRYNIPQRYLPDLKEESHEDSSLNTSASNLKSSHFRFPHGSGPGMRTSVDDAIVFSRRSSTRSHRRSAVAGVHGLPSMEFSQSNLLDKLNDAFGGLRYSRSLGQLRLDLPTAEEGLPQRPISAGEVRELTHDLIIGPGGSDKVEQEMKIEGLIDLAKSKRVLLPENLMAELDQVTIPSVKALTQRITEMLPSLEEYYRQSERGGPGEFPDEEEIMEHALEEIHEVHPPSQKRSSARLRAIPGSSGLVVMEDDVYEELANKERGRRSPAGGQSEGSLDTGAGEVDTRARSTDKTTTHTAIRQLSPVAELQAPSPVQLRPRSHTIADQALRTSVESELSSRRSLRSFVSNPTATATDTRPWNFEKNYPWTTTSVPSVDISLPSAKPVNQSPRAGPSHLRNTLSDASDSTSATACTPATWPTGHTTSFNTNRQSHRLSNFGRAGDQAHAVGERYPTSALSPPTAIFRDLSNCDTSDDEDFTTSRKSNKRPLRKRFSSTTRNNTLTTTPRVARSRVNPAELASPASDPENSSSTLQGRASENNAFTSHRHTFRDAQGMGSSAYHRRRLVERCKRL